jgi:cell division protein ZapE
VADQFAGRARIICLDEFHVGDITDAMLLGSLLRALFERGVALVATSNEAPQRLYWGGLQRERFLPAIALIEAHMDIVHLEGDVDYRLRALESAEIYHTPLDAQADASLARAFAALAPEPGVPSADIDLDGRPLTTVCAADGIAWVDFEALCGAPRGARDYIELARCYQTVVLANVPIFGVDAEDRARRFIHLIDELYDRNVKLVVSAAAPPSALYTGERLRAAFARTASRLVEMQSLEYLARPHSSD